MATKAQTEWGELNIVLRRNRYYYAVKTINGLRRQIYLGKSMPGQGRLEEVAEEINLPTKDWLRLHPPAADVRRDKLLERHANGNRVSELVIRLAKVEAQLSARSDRELAQEVRAVMKGIEML